MCPEHFVEPVNLSEYLGAVREIVGKWSRDSQEGEPWYRGQGSDWPLKPKIYRGQVASLFEREVTRDFRLRALRLLDGDRPQSSMEWLFLGQHYGLPSRLLDWSENPLVALFFACEDLDTKVDACVSILYPWDLNVRSIELSSVPEATHPILESYVINPQVDGLGREVAATLPVAVRPPHSTSRIVAQRGVFTIHGQGSTGIERLSRDWSIRYEEIRIPGYSKGKLLKELYRVGVTWETLFPDLSGLAASLIYRYSRRAPH